jgi:dihydroxy-acid dehydratase
MVHEDLKPSDILTLDAFHNAIASIRPSADRPMRRSIWPRLRAMSASVPLSDWQEIGHKIPLLVNLQPAGEYLGEDYYRAGGVPAVVAQLMGQGLIREGAMTVNGKTMGENCRNATIEDERSSARSKPIKEEPASSC